MSAHTSQQRERRRCRQERGRRGGAALFAAAAVACTPRWNPGSRRGCTQRSAADEPRRAPRDAAAVRNMAWTLGTEQIARGPDMPGRSEVRDVRVGSCVEATTIRGSQRKSKIGPRTFALRGVLGQPFTHCTPRVSTWHSLPAQTDRAGRVDTPAHGEIGRDAADGAFRKPLFQP